MALWTIKLNEEFRDDGQLFSVQVRLRIVMLLIILEDIEARRQRLHIQQEESLSGSELDRLLDLMNRAEYQLLKLETDIQTPL